MTIHEAGPQLCTGYSGSSGVSGCHHGNGEPNIDVMFDVLSEPWL